MAFNQITANRIRLFMSHLPAIKVSEKKMFGGLAFIINGKMCVNVSGENLMCRFDPLLTSEVSERKGYLPLKMKGRTYKGYCYVEPDGFSENNDFEYWLKLCLQYNEQSV